MDAPNNPYLPKQTRVRKLTPRLRRRFIELLAQGHSPTRAAQAVGVTRPAVYYWRENDFAFRKAWEEALEERADRYEDALEHSAIEQHNIGGIIFGLKNLRSDKWKDRHEVEERRSVEVSVTMDSLPPGQREALVQALMRHRADNSTGSVPALPPPSDSNEGSSEQR